MFDPKSVAMRPIPYSPGCKRKAAQKATAHVFRLPLKLAVYKTAKGL
jgi:hypothetical protein